MTHPINLKINGSEFSGSVEDDLLLVDFLRERLGLTGTHVGCDTTQCGACIVHVNERSIKSCSLLAVQADQCEITTIEGLADGDRLHPLQIAFRQEHALQCGFCTPGMIMSALHLLQQNADPDEATVREFLDSNFCRCTGYENIVKAVRAAAAMMRAQ